MRRGLVNILTGLSLLLCAATVALWGRSGRVGDAFCCDSAERLEDGVFFSGGMVYAFHSRQHPGLWVADELRDGPAPVRSKRLWWRRAPADFKDQFRVNVADERAWLGFGSWRGRSHVMGFRCAFAPLWPVVVVSLVGPGARVWFGARRRWRGARGRCANCGYDLRATPTVCPECGRRCGKGDANRVRACGLRF